MNTLYTLGYQGWKPDAITNIVRELDATLLDIRLVPTSPYPGWRRSAFEQRFEAAGMTSQYKTASGFGNVNYRNGGPIQLKAPEAYIMATKMLLEATPLILLCGCRDHATCHRTAAAQFISEYIGGVEVVHLYPDTV